MNDLFRIAIFASGNGTNAEAIMKYFQNHKAIAVGLVLSNNQEAKVLDRATQFSMPSLTFNRTEFKDSTFMLSVLEEHSISHIVLAGFMWLIPSYLVRTYSHRIVNIHPALLPKHGGKGMYGMHVHEAVKAAGETSSGITIHEVNEHYDEGKILVQKTCSISPSDSAEDIADKIHALEYEWYPKQIEQWLLNK